MWFICCGMRRSASTLHYNIVKRVLPDAVDIGWIIHQKFEEIFFEVNDPKKSFILKCHPHLPSRSDVARNLFDHGQAAGIYTYRDIRDVIASLKRLRPTMYTDRDSIDGLAMMYGDTRSIIHEDRLWRNEKNMMISRYETMMKNLEVEIACLLKFLYKKGEVNALSYYPSVLANEFSIDAMRERAPKDKWDKETTMWPNHVGTGEVGQWKKALTSEEIDIVMKHGKQWLIDRGYEI